MLVKYITDMVFLQFLTAIFIWLFLFILLEKYLKYRDHLNYSSAIYFIIYYTLLSIFAIVRIFWNILPDTSDSFLYLSIAEEIERGMNFHLFGSHVYGNIVYIIKTITFNNYYAILFLNIFIFIIALVDLTSISPQFNRHRNWIWFGFLLIYPSIYWFVPNVLRESIYIYIIVNILCKSLNMIHDKINIKNICLLILYCSIAVIIRPQTLPILFIWLVFLFYRKHFGYGILVMCIGLLFLNTDYVINLRRLN